MELELDLSLCPGSDLWDPLDVDESDVSVDVLMPNGYFMSVRVPRDVTLYELKEEVWESSQQLPLFGLLRDSDCYVFQCVNLATARREDIADEERRLCDVRPFQAVLRLVERKEQAEDKMLDTKLGFVIGQALREFDDQKDPEVHDFRKAMKVFCETMCSDLLLESWESQVLRQYPVFLEQEVDLPETLQAKLPNGKIVLAISVGDHSSESTFKVSVVPGTNAQQLFELLLEKKGPSIGLHKITYHKSVLKICGLEEFLLGPHALSQYKYIRESLIRDKIPELVLVSRDSITLEKSPGKPEGLTLERQRSRSFTGECTGTLKKKKQNSVSCWGIHEPLSITIHSIHKLSNENKTKVAVQCGLYHGDENLCSAVHTTERLLEDGVASWEERIAFSLELSNLPRMCKLCICVYEVSPTQKNSRFRKCQDKYACPIAWVNTPVFDYHDTMRSVPLALSIWSYPQEADEYSGVMVRPLGFTGSNPSREQSALLSISFTKYHPTAQVVYPSLEEVLEYADGHADESCSTPCNMRQASKLHLQQLRQICEKDTLYQLHEQEKQLMWFLRRDCRDQLPDSLPKLLRCVKWNDRKEIAQMTRLLNSWPAMTSHRALELLDYACPEPLARSFAVRCLQKVADEELSLYLLQLVQALKREPYLQNSLTRFLMERALRNRHNGHKLFWLLRSEIHVHEVSIRFGLILEAYCRCVPTHLEALEKQIEALNRLKMANHLIQNKSNLKRESREKLKGLIQGLLENNLYKKLVNGLQNPLDPRFKFKQIKFEKCKFLDSKMKPLWLAFENTDNYGKDVFLIFKNGDDLRQDMLTLQMIRIMDRLWKNEGMDLRMIPYQCLATGHRVGLIEVVPDADTIANIQKEKGFTATSAFKKGSLLAWLRDHNPDDLSLSKAAEQFTLSCAGYCVATYVLGIADRHSDNIMVKTNGQLFHIDFGHILGKFKEKFGFKRERVPFVLTHDFVYIITKGNTQRSQEFSRFQQCCEQAFMILRRQGPLVISLFAMMLSTGIPELSSERDLDYLRETLVLDMSEQDALRHFQSKFDEALKNSWKTSVNWMAHNWAKDNKMFD